MKKFFWIVMLLLALAVGGYSIVQYLVVGIDKAGLVITKIKSMGTPSFAWYVSMYVHIVFSAIALVIGPFLFSARFRQRWLDLHRSLGKVYLSSILFGGSAGLFLSFHASGGKMSTLGFFLLSILWLYTGYIAFRQIKRGNVSLHRQWMIRNYALTLAGVTLRIWLPLCFVVFGASSFDTFYQVLAWISWVPNFLIANWYVRQSTNKPNYSS
jgi:uncharacterized membrane protein